MTLLPPGAVTELQVLLPHPTLPSNLIPNPNGEDGGWGYYTARAGTRTGGTKYVDNITPLYLTVTTGTATVLAEEVTTERFPVTAGQWIGGGASAPPAVNPNGARVRGRWLFYDAAGAVSVGPFSAYGTTDTQFLPRQVTAGTTHAALQLWLDRNGQDIAAGYVFKLNRVHAELGATQASVQTVAYSPPIWSDLLGDAAGVSVERSELDVSTLVAQVNDALLDPRVAPDLKPGRPIRLRVRVPAPAPRQATTEFEQLYTGRIVKANVVYDTKAKRARKRAKISVTAVDALTTAAGTPSPNGVATLAELRSLFELDPVTRPNPIGVPWDVDGSLEQAAVDPVFVSRNDNATLLDQVALTRDSVLGRAWVSRRGVFTIRSAGAPAPATYTFTEDDYTDLAVDFETGRCINTVSIRYLRFSPTTGEPEEVTYGPYVDRASVLANDPQPATFTVHGIVESEANMAAYAQTILNANAWPKRRVQSIELPGRLDTGGINGFKRLKRSTLVDLGDAVRVINVAEGIDETLRVESVEHTLTPRGMTTRVGFVAANGVASPATQPEQPAGDNGSATLAQLLRPVGEVTMWYGLRANVPDGWLVCDGAGFSSATYPKLAELLGGTLLPDFNDRVPVGASAAKPLASAGGAEDRSIAAHRHAGVAHTHSIDSANVGTNTQTNTTTGGTATRVTGLTGGSHNHGGATGQAGGGDTGLAGAASFNVLQPYRALHFIIRAK